MDKIFFISSIIILLIVLFFIVKKSKEIKKEQKLTADEIWEKKRKEYESEINEIAIIKDELLENYNKLLEQQKSLLKDIKEKETFNNSLLKLREEELDRLIEEKRKEKEKALNLELDMAQSQKIMALNAEFSEYSSQQQKIIDSMLEETKKIQNELEDFRTQREAINQAIALENSKEEEKLKHQISLSLQDKEDIKYLLSIEEKINNKQLLRKLIWSEYLQKPFNEMLKRLFLGNPPKNVIYCIENIHNHKKYIGKTSAEVSKRWTEHIKTSLEIGTIKSQNIHKALYGHWDEFTFSVIAVSEKEKISADEKYYIKFFESDIYGYNMKSGG